MHNRWANWVLLFSLLCTAVGAAQWTPVQAQGEVPQPFSTPPLPPEEKSQIDVASQANSLNESTTAFSTVSLSGLKAVLLVGPIDGDTGTWTTSEIHNMELAASELEANGVTVYRFYTPDNDWEQIKAASRGAHFLFYRGHGIAWSSGPTPVVGGFALKGRVYSADTIRKDLQLAPNAIVMMYACYTAGSSGDDVTLSSAEAYRRVAQYSDPFFDLGSGGYYANWHGSAFQTFVRYLFQGMTLGQAYETFYDFNPASVERYNHPDHPDLAMWLDKDIWAGGTKYDNAFAGKPHETLTSLFGVPTRMELNPGAVMTFLEPGSSSQTYTIWVDSSNDQSFAWLASAEFNQPWIKVTPLTGSSGAYLQVQLDPQNLKEGVYQTSIQVQATTPGVEQSEQDLTVTLVLCVPRKLFLPVMGK